MKVLSIIIPRYSETEQEIMPLLASIRIQIGINFDALEVLIVNDGGAVPLPDDFLSRFDPMDIIQISLPDNIGPGMVRQFGIDVCHGDYVMFCDADDILHSAGVLEAIMQEMVRTDADLVTTNWLEEVRTDDGGHVYMQHESEMTWMHGKVFRRAFLAGHNIRHHKQLRIHEDSYFLAMLSAESPKHSHIPMQSYIWRYYDDTITRRDNAAYSYNSVPTFIFAVSEARRVVRERHPDRDETGAILQHICYIYFLTHCSQWLLPEHEADRKSAEDAFMQYVGPELSVWQSADRRTRDEMYNAERARVFSGNVETETIDQWLSRLTGDAS